MLASMTGFAKSKGSFGHKELVVEIKSLNSKFVDLRIKLPFQYRTKEYEVRRLIQESRLRGKLEVTVVLNGSTESEQYKINKTLFTKFYRELSDLQSAHGITHADLMQTIIRIPNVIAVDDQDVDAEEWGHVEGLLRDSLSQLMEFELEEGKMITRELDERVQQIQHALISIQPFEKERLEFIRRKLEKDILEMGNNPNFDKNRLEQEILYYLEKLDFTEEKVRLDQHCKYFLEVLFQMEIMKGKKLGFISQEMGREINTLGSKAQHSAIQKIVVQMKDELEKIKEQLANVM